ncbi:hypothetical protein Yalta_005 [Yalta virus]|nr:hypothetical protein Yalta_005 [Yalta virus]
MTYNCFTIIIYLTWDNPNSYFCLFRTRDEQSLKKKKNYNNISRSCVKTQPWFRCKIYQRDKIYANIFEHIFTTKLQEYHIKDNVYNVSLDQFIKIWGEVHNEHLKQLRKIVIKDVN